ncbi:hypothetical protein DJICPGNB_05450 [Escherichia coli]|nr:hypothetical protein DJICPGNB_05450 [Escherichia coli]
MGDLCAVEELADALGAYLGTVFGFQDLKDLADNARCRQDQALVGTFLRVLLIKEDAFLPPPSAQET